MSTTELPFERHKQRTPFTLAKLSPEEKRLSQHTVAAMLSHAQWWSQIMYSELRWRPTHDVPTAATDEYSIFVNPPWFYKMPLGQRVFVCCHEVMHYVLWHCSLSYKWYLAGEVITTKGRRLKYYPSLMNIAMDYIINPMLIVSKVGECPPDGLYDPRISAKGMEAVVQVYEMLYDENGMGKGKSDVKHIKVRRFDGRMGEADVSDVLLPGVGSGDLVQESMDKGEGPDERKQKILRAVARATAACKQIGKLPAGLQDLITELLEPVIEWPDAYRTLCQRKLGTDGYDYTSVDRRLILRNIGGPRLSDFTCGPIVIIGDSSGSIPQAALNRFFAETVGVFDNMKPSHIYFMWCDAAVGEVFELESIDDLLDGAGVNEKLNPKGRGGTDFRPPWEWMDENGVQPDLVIYFTDGYGAFPASSPWPTIWAMTTDVTPPFGDIVKVPLDECK